MTPNFANPFWQAYSFLLIALAATHGFNGLRGSQPITFAARSCWPGSSALLLFLWLLVLVGSVFLIFVFAG